MVASIAPGQEIELCQLFPAPPEGLYMNREETRYTPGSHHVLLYTTPYRSMPKTDRKGAVVEAPSPHDCSEGVNARWETDSIVAGAQSPKANALALPEGVAVAIPPGTFLVMNTHYINASSKTMEVEAKVNLYGIPKSEVKTEAGLLFYYNPFIRVPAGSASSARMRCPVSKAIELVNVQSHMHRRGTHFEAHRTDANGIPSLSIYTSTSWDDVPIKTFDPPLSIRAGEALDYRCDYVNLEPRDVMQGFSTKDEMCMLIGSYFPRDVRLERCEDENGFPAATWIGGGTATGAQTLACLEKARPASEDGGNEFYGCVVDSCPGAAEQVSAFVRCKITNGFNACNDACQKGEAACRDCTSAACASEAAASRAASCGP